MNSELKQTYIKNPTCYYFDEIFSINGFDLDNNLLDKESNERILIFYAACKTSFCVKPRRIVFDKVDGYIRKYESTKYLALFYSGEKYE